MDHVQGKLGISERRACQGVGQARSTQRRKHKIRNDEAVLTESVIRLATQYGRYGYRRIRAMLKAEGWHVSYKRVYRIWRRLVCMRASGTTAESPIKTTQTRPTVTQRWVMRPTSS